MNALRILNKAVKTMSSLEIAELTGKRHDNVMRDINNTLKEAEISPLKFEVTRKIKGLGDNPDRDSKIYNLPRRECDLVISGYSVKYRMAIIDRWQELESQQTQPKKLSRVELATNWLEAEIDALKFEQTYSIVNL